MIRVVGSKVTRSPEESKGSTNWVDSSSPLEIPMQSFLCPNLVCSHLDGEQKVLCMSPGIQDARLQ